MVELEASSSISQIRINVSTKQLKLLYKHFDAAIAQLSLFFLKTDDT